MISRGWKQCPWLITHVTSHRHEVVTIQVRYQSTLSGNYEPRLVEEEIHDWNRFWRDRGKKNLYRIMM
jgi:hypothetical protein